MTRAKKTLRPFLRWAGSKQKLLEKLTPYIPKRYGTYYEVFSGSAALLLRLQPRNAIVSDTNIEIINAFNNIKRHGEEIEDRLLSMTPNKDTFYAIRGSRSLDSVSRTVEFLYMNKVCWNGLFRVNKKGEFNVPYGSPKTNFIVQKNQIRDVQAYLNENNIHFQCTDFEFTCRDAKSGDFVFFDPPYVTTHNNNGFIEYNEDIFSWSDQVRLSGVCGKLIERGVHVLMTNAYHKEVLNLFKGMSVTEISRHSTLASDITRRKIVSESIFFSG